MFKSIASQVTEAKVKLTYPRSTRDLKLDMVEIERQYNY